MADVYRAQHLLITRQQLPMGITAILASCLVGITMVEQFGLLRTGVWVIPIVLSGMLQIWSWSRFRGKPAPENISGNFLRKGENVAIFAGLCWGASSLAFVGTSSSQHMLFLYVIQAGMAAGVVALMTPLPRHTARFVIPCLAPSSMAFLFGGEFVLPISAMAVVFCCVLINSSIDSYQNLKEVIGKTYEANLARNFLVDAIESTNDAFAFYAPDGELALQNQQHNKLFEHDATLSAVGGSDDKIETIQRNGRWLIRSRKLTGQGGTVVVHTDITDLKRRERDLEIARQEAIEADAAKSRFVSTMSNELLTPLNIMMGSSRLMASDSKIELDRKTVAEYSDIITESGQHLANLIDDIIDYSNVGLDPLEMQVDEVEVDAFLDRAIQHVRGAQPDSEAFEIDVTISPKLAKLRIDERANRRIMINLLSNAIKFGGVDQRVLVQADMDSEGRPFISCRDFGNGVPESELEKVFDPFYQLDRTQGGTGIGLTLSRHLARLQGGDVVLNSRQGVGTTAVLVLPAAAFVEPIPQAYQSDKLKHIA